MGKISVGEQALRRHVADGPDGPDNPGAHGGAYGASYQRAFSELAASHRRRPAVEILPLLRRAADQALLGFTGADLREQAEAISTGKRYELRITIP